MNTQNLERNYSLDFLKTAATICIIFHHYQQITGANFENGINFFYDWFYWGYLLAMFIKKHNISKNMVFLCILVFLSTTCLFIRYSHLVKDDLSYILTFIMYPSIIILLESNWIKKIFHHSVWGILANISFNTYIWHNLLFPAMYIVCHLLHITPDFSLYSSMLIFASIAWTVGGLSHYLLEKPINQWINNRVAPKI